MATIQEVARLAGVSTATVSRSFNSPGLLSKETERRVLEVAERLNYRPRKARLARNRPTTETGLGTATIGFQFFAASPSDTLAVNDFYGPVLAGAMDEASELGLNLLVHTTHRKRLSEELPKMVRDQAVSGMLLVGTADPEILDMFSAQIAQIVLVDNRDAHGKFDGIVSDGFRGATEAVNYLYKLGHRRIGFLWETPEIITFQDRYHGYLCALIEKGLPIDPDLILCTHGPDEDTQPEMEAFLKRPDRPTAMFCVNDFNAVTFMRACRACGVGVPEDISLVGFDDIQLASHSHPALSTIRVQKEYLGRLGVRRLLYHLQNPNPRTLDEVPILIEVPVSLVERSSCRSL